MKKGLLLWIEPSINAKQCDEHKGTGILWVQKSILLNGSRQCYANR